MTKQPESVQESELAGLPGADFVLAGLKELRDGKALEYGLLVLVAAPRLKALGLDVPTTEGSDEPPEHQLYSYLETHRVKDPYSHYNSLLRRMASFAQALEQQNTQRYAKPKEVPVKRE